MELLDAFSRSISNDNRYCEPLGFRAKGSGFGVLIVILPAVSSLPGDPGQGGQKEEQRAHAVAGRPHTSPMRTYSPIPLRKVARQRFRLPLQGARASTLGEPERGHGNGQVRDHAHNTGAPIYCFAGSLIYLKYNGHQNPIKIIKAPVLDPYAVQSSVCSHAQLHEVAENIARARALAASSAMDPEAPLSLN